MVVVRLPGCQVETEMGRVPPVGTVGRLQAPQTSLHTLENGSRSARYGKALRLGAEGWHGWGAGISKGWHGGTRRRPFAK